MKHSSKLASHRVKLLFSNRNCSYSDLHNQRKTGKNIHKLVSLKTKIWFFILGIPVSALAIHTVTLH